MTRALVDRVATVVLAAAVVLWSVLYALLGPLFLRPVSTCAGPELRCTGLVDLGVGVGSLGPIVVTVVMLAAIAWAVARRRPTTPAAVVAVVLVLVLTGAGQALAPLGVIAR